MEKYHSEETIPPGREIEIEEEKRELAEIEEIEEILDSMGVEDTEENEENKEEEIIEWDGSEAELVLDEDASQFEELYTGIRLSCDLTEQEIYKALKRFSFTKTAGIRAVIEAVFLVAAGGAFLWYYISAKESFSLFFGVISFLLAAVVLFLPAIGRRNMAKRIRQNKEKSHVELSIYPDEVTVGSHGSSWEFPLDGSCQMEEYENMILLFPAGKNAMVILPLRCIEPSVLPEVEAMLFSGTVSKTE